jgi:hypothetical protein
MKSGVPFYIKTRRDARCLWWSEYLPDDFPVNSAPRCVPQKRKAIHILSKVLLGIISLPWLAQPSEHRLLLDKSQKRKNYSAVKFILEQATKTQKGSIGIALLFF